MAIGSPRDGSLFDTGPQTLAAGVVAYNEEGHLRASVKSLTEQELPRGVEWGEIWVVASGCTDRTVEVARSLADEDRRVRLVVESERGGKARALGQVFDRARGDALVLLNSDARAEPHAVEHLLRTASGKTPPFAVMGRPVVPYPVVGRWASTFRWMWDLHHEFHAELLSNGGGGHLSDELLLVSLPNASPIPDGIINDGSYLAVWLSQHAGGRWYAEDARVSIEVPETVRDHLHQRRRIHVGNTQVNSVLREPPSTIPRRLVERPADTIRLLRKMMARPRGWEHFARLATWEVAAYALAAWDRLPPRTNHVLWRPIQSSPPGAMSGASERAGSKPPLSSAGSARIDRRITTVVGVASQFGTGVELPDLVRLLPQDAPATVPEVREWLTVRPHLARVEGGSAFAPEAVTISESERRARGHRYLSSARALFRGPLRPAKEWSRCACVTGSTAYGTPEEGDDLDLFVVTRTGGLWWFLAYSYLVLRIQGWARRGPVVPTPCFNFIVDDREAVEEFSRPRGFLFAREALTAQPVHGDGYYRGLLAAGSWIREEIPRLYAEKDPEGSGGVTPPAASPPLVRLLSLLVFPWLAAYLQVVGLRRNAAYRRGSLASQQFRTETGWRRLAFASQRFERLRERYGGSAVPRTTPARADLPSRHGAGNGHRRFAGASIAPPRSE